jgi:hypothetical protein
MMDRRSIRYAFAVSAAAALLVACASSQSQILAPGAMRSATSGYGYSPALSGGTGLLPDGDFSEAPQPAPTYAPIYRKRSVFAPDWVVSRRNINFQSSLYWDVDGLCSVDLDGNYAVGGIKTNPFTLPAGSYTLSFVLSGNGGGPPTIKQMKVIVGVQLTTFDWNISSGNDAQDGDYTTETWNFTKTKSGSTVLRFVSQDPKGSTYGPVVAGIAIAQN